MSYISEYDKNNFNALSSKLKEAELNLQSKDANIEEQINTLNSVNASRITNLTNTLNGKINKADLLNICYPINSCYITTTNTNPSTTIGGTWELIDKLFAEQTLSGSSLFTINTTNVTSLSSMYAVLSGHQIHIRLIITNKVACGETNVEIGTLNLAKIGVTNLALTAYGVGQSDGSNAIPIFTLNNGSGKLTNTDSVVEASIAAGKNIVYEWVFIVKQSDMIDSFCNQFIWKRTA